MEINKYFTLLKQGRQELDEYEEILSDINKLKIKAKKNIILQKNYLTMA